MIGISNIVSVPISGHHSRLGPSNRRLVRSTGPKVRLLKFRVCPHIRVPQPAWTADRRLDRSIGSRVRSPKFRVCPHIPPTKPLSITPLKVES